MKVLKNILFWTTTAVLILAIAVVGISKFSGIEFLAVRSGSMEPDLPVGSLVVVVPTPAEDIRIGDDITFVSVGNKIVTHRVVEIDKEANTFTTWGIANQRGAVDPPNYYENVIGVVKYNVPVVGQAFIFIDTLHGKIIVVTAIIAIYILSIILKSAFSGKKKNKEEIKTNLKAETV